MHRHVNRQRFFPVLLVRVLTNAIINNKRRHSIPRSSSYYLWLVTHPTNGIEKPPAAPPPPLCEWPVTSSLPLLRLALASGYKETVEPGQCTRRLGYIRSSKGTCVCVFKPREKKHQALRRISSVITSHERTERSTRSSRPNHDDLFVFGSPSG